MTDPAEPLPEDRDPDSPSSDSSESAAAETEAASTSENADAATTGTDGASAGDEEGLPEWEPLTPELAEDEAIRGDFMLRWAVILLAVLMGWTFVQETEVLTHIRAGDALVAEGFWPSGRDTLASTTQNSRWVHLDWLFDVGLSGVYAAMGETGLTVLKVLLAAVTFYLLSRISVPGAPTWWGSVCAALALVACFPSLTATPHLITLLGMTILLLLLHRRSVDPDVSLAVPVIVTMLVWSQLDNRAWIGAAALLAYALGHQWDLRRADAEGTSRGGSLLPAAMLGLLVMLLHPFLWETWLSAVRLYRDEYPALQTYAISQSADYFRSFSILSPDYWSINYFNGAALLLWGVTLVTLVLNAARVTAAHLALFVTVSLIAAAGGTELAVGSIVFAALGTLNAQQWYVASFRQTYSVEAGELLFSRGGRALTVIALFGLGFMMVAGHVTGAAGRRVGTGFSGELQQSIDSYSAVMAEAVDDRPFAFRPTQGDVLNWVGQHPFIDSRLRLFAAGAPSIIDEHLEARMALGPLDGSPPARDVWQPIFDKYDINQALPRLSGGSPDYNTFYDLLRSPDWALIDLDADTASFCRTDRSDPELAAFVADHGQSDLVQAHLRQPEADVVSELRTVWPSSPSVYSQYFYQPLPTASRPLQRAGHYLGLSQGLPSADQAVSALYASVRDAHRGLVDNPSDSRAYMLLGQAYATLWSFERGLMEAQQQVYPGALRYAQTASAYHQAIVCDPDASQPHLRLFGLYTQQQRHDLALRHLREFQRITGRLTPLPESDPRSSAEQQQMEEYLAQLTAQVDEVRSQRDDDLVAGMEPAALAGTLMQQGYPLAALEVIESDLTQLSGKPELAFLYARLLLEAGRTREAYDQLQSLKTITNVSQLPGGVLYEAIGSLVAEDPYAALKTLEDDQLAMSSAAAIAMLYQHPLQATERTDVTQPIDPLGPIARRLQLGAVYFDQLLPRIEGNTLNRALIDLELGRNAEAAQLFEQLLQEDPLAGTRPVAETYLRLLKEKPEIPELPDAEKLMATIPDLTADETRQAEAGPGGKDAAGEDMPPEPAAEAEKTSEDAEQESQPGKSADSPEPEDKPGDGERSGGAPPQNDAPGEPSDADEQASPPAADSEAADDAPADEPAPSSF